MFEETTVETFLIDYEMFYLPDDIDPEKKSSPIGIITYQEYTPSWWIELNKKLGGIPEITPESWVIILEFNVEEMFRKKIDLEDIASAIEGESEGKYVCVPSPNVIGKIEVYLNFSEIKMYVKEKIELPESSANESENKSKKRELINDDNIDFFVCRDVAINYIKKIHISGIKGVSRIYPREDTSTYEWVMDVACSQIKPHHSVSRFLNILTSEDVDSYRTTCDDMWSILNVLGIEAVRKFLIREMTRIISFDGTYINPRHIQLLVDNMTNTGDITSVRRDGIHRDAGPISKIMFEQAVDNAGEASVFGEVDHLQSVASAVMFGLNASAGTGAVEIQHVDRIPVKPHKIGKNDVIYDDYTSTRKSKNRKKKVNRRIKG